MLVLGKVSIDSPLTNLSLMHVTKARLSKSIWNRGALHTRPPSKFRSVRCFSAMLEAINDSATLLSPNTRQPSESQVSTDSNTDAMVRSDDSDEIDQLRTALASASSAKMEIEHEAARLREALAAAAADAELRIAELRTLHEQEQDQAEEEAQKQINALASELNTNAVDTHALRLELQGFVVEKRTVEVLEARESLAQEHAAELAAEAERRAQEDEARLQRDRQIQQAYEARSIELQRSLDAERSKSEHLQAQLDAARSAATAPAPLLARPAKRKRLTDTTSSSTGQ